jgi:hypothetical protein
MPETLNHQQHSDMMASRFLSFQDANRSGWIDSLPVKGASAAENDDRLLDFLPFLYKGYLYNNRAMVRWLLVPTARWSECLINHNGSSAV